MNSKKSSLTNRKSGKKFPDFFLCILLMLPFSFFAQKREFAEIKGYVYDMYDSTLIPNANIACKLDTFIFMVKTDSFGFYSFQLDKKQLKKVTFYAQTNKYIKTETSPCGFLATDQRYTINPSALDSVQREYNFPLMPISCCGPPPLRFLFNKDGLTVLDSVRQSEYNSKTDSFYDIYIKTTNDIMLLYKTLVENPSMIIELSGHCSSNEKDKELGLKRSEIIKQILVLKGIPPERIVTKGYGNSRLKITDKQISKAKTKEEKEALHQINRRVVFKIISWDYPAPKPQEKRILKYHPTKR